MMGICVWLRGPVVQRQCGAVVLHLEVLLSYFCDNDFWVRDWSSLSQ
jgi:hypothetical protein